MRLPRVSAPVHGIDFSQMPPQCPSSAHLNSANGVDVSCDLNRIKTREKKNTLRQLNIFLGFTLKFLMHSVSTVTAKHRSS